jgi:hypothetical protein
MFDQGKYYVRVTWGPREESLGQCADRVQQCVNGLSPYHDVFAHWIAKSRPLPIDRNAILERFQEEESREGFSARLGYSLRLWNGRNRDSSIAIQAHCSSYDPAFVNHSSLTLPGKGEVAARLIRCDILTQLLTVLVRAWEPDFGEVMRAEFFHEQMKRQVTTRPDVPLVGWMTYLSNARGGLPTLPSDHEVVQLEGLGSIVLTTEETFLHEHPDHRRAVETLTGILGSAGLLGPIANVARLR